MSLYDHPPQQHLVVMECSFHLVSLLRILIRNFPGKWNEWRWNSRQLLLYTVINWLLDCMVDSFNDRLINAGGGEVLNCEGDSTWIWTLPLCQKDHFLWQIFHEFRTPFAWISGSFVTMPMNFVILSIYGCKVYSNFFSCDKNSELATHLTELRLKTDSYKGNFMWKGHRYERHVQYHLTIKYLPPQELMNGDKKKICSH